MTKNAALESIEVRIVLVKSNDFLLKSLSKFRNKSQQAFRFYQHNRGLRVKYSKLCCILGESSYNKPAKSDKKRSTKHNVRTGNS